MRLPDEFDIAQRNKLISASEEHCGNFARAHNGPATLTLAVFAANQIMKVFSSHSAIK